MAEVAMKQILFAILVSILSMCVLSDTALAERKTQKEIAIGKCDRRHAACDQKCDQLIDIGTQVRDCKNQCSIKNSKCILRAGRVGPLPSQSGTDGTNGPILAPQ